MAGAEEGGSRGGWSVTETLRLPPPPPPALTGVPLPLLATPPLKFAPSPLFAPPQLLCAPPQLPAVHKTYQCQVRALQEIFDKDDVIPPPSAPAPEKDPHLSKPQPDKNNPPGTSSTPRVNNPPDNQGCSLRVLPQHKARLTVAATPPRESSVPVLNSALTPDSMPPILSPQTSLVVAEVHMDEADPSGTPHLSSTNHPGTTKISAKCHQGSSRVSGGTRFSEQDIDHRIIQLLPRKRNLFANFRTYF
ncbi:pollen-specific leucine-rich repeat extensin-like protein 4 [Homarus americanus]|uniref:pollen-specific leucine-rich repeat extensin-like protein 4 n=1 Tax=Homarus americanus TaxID=6706 RepID=UPI001C472EE0|nr:pollen-specific leucine-rich repeat extensin-like protein 4 [Homarus americanus]